MRAICLSVAGLVCGALGQAAAPAILSFTELKSLEGLWAAHPDDRDLTNQLSSNYGLDALGVTGFGSNGVISGWAKTQPELALQTYAREALAEQKSGAILGGAGIVMFTYSSFRNNTDGRDSAQALIERAIGAQPGENRWRVQRIYMTVSREQFPSWKHLTSAEAYPLAKADLDLVSGNSRAFPAGKVALLAVRAGKLDDARTLAHELLASDDGRNTGETWLKGYTVLGLIALKEGDMASAKGDLLNAGNGAGTPTTRSFGPTMILAKALLDAGQNDVVLEYFDECRKFWKMDRGRLDQWSAAVRAGKKPDFGGNLVY